LGTCRRERWSCRCSAQEQRAQDRREGCYLTASCLSGDFLWPMKWRAGRPIQHFSVWIALKREPAVLDSWSQLTSISPGTYHCFLVTLPSLDFLSQHLINLPNLPVLCSFTSIHAVYPILSLSGRWQ